MASSAQNPQDTAFAQNKWLDFFLKIGLLFFTPLLLIGGLEGIAAIWENDQAKGIYAWEMVASRRLDLIEYPGPGAGYTLMAPNRQYNWQGIPVEINSQGLRGPETPFTKPPDTYRILNLGDSVSMGWGVSYEDTYGNRLAELLNAESSGGYAFEVINAGVPGWNPSNYLAYLESEGLSYQPDLIVLELTLVNDIYGQGALERNQRPAVIEWLRSKTHFWPFLSIQLQWLNARMDGKERIAVIDPPTDPSSYFPLDPDAARWSSLWAEVRAINDLATQHDAEFLVVLLPLELQVLDEQFPSLPQALLTEAAQEAEIRTIDLLPAFEEACKAKPGGSCQLEDRYLFADVWMHPSPLGHELIAQEIWAHLQTDIRQLAD